MAKPKRQNTKTPIPQAPDQAFAVAETESILQFNEANSELLFLQPDPDLITSPPLQQLAPSDTKSKKQDKLVKSTPKPEKPHYSGHRQRLRQRFNQYGEHVLADYELLELLLFRSVPRSDTKPLAKALLARFGSFSGVFGAESKLLQEVTGCGPAVAADLKLIAASAKRLGRSEILGQDILDSWNKVVTYCMTAMAYETREQFRILFLDKKNRLIADEIQQIGTVDHTPVYPREVIKRALELSATALILCHNHPSGDATPSRTDVDMTKVIISIASPLGITVHDHIIIGKGGHSSMRGMQLI